MSDTLSTAELNNVEPVALELAGHELPMRACVAKNGNVYFAVREKDAEKPVQSGFGEPIPALAPHLPDHVVVAGTKVALQESLSSVFTNRKTGRRETKVYEPGTRVTASEPITLNGEDRVFKLTLSVRQNGEWNLKASVIRPGGGGSNTRKAKNLSAL